MYDVTVTSEMTSYLRHWWRHTYVIDDIKQVTDDFKYTSLMTPNIRQWWRHTYVIHDVIEGGGGDVRDSLKWSIVENRERPAQLHTVGRFTFHILQNKRFLRVLSEEQTNNDMVRTILWITLTKNRAYDELWSTTNQFISPDLRPMYWMLLVTTNLVQNEPFSSAPVGSLSAWSAVVRGISTRSPT